MLVRSYLSQGGKERIEFSKAKSPRKGPREHQNEKSRRARRKQDLDSRGKQETTGEKKILKE